jgi:nicotinamidase-related amidase
VTTVLLVIDMQQDFFKHARLTLRRPALVRSTNEIVTVAREVGVPVVWVKTEYASDLSDGSLEIRKGQIRITIAGTRGAELLPELNALSSEYVILKKRYSAFFGTDLDRLLARHNCSQVIIAGINTHACVRTTVVDAYQRDFEILLARDCIDSYDEEHDRITWRYMDGKLGNGLTNEQLIYKLRQLQTA